MAYSKQVNFMVCNLQLNKDVFKSVKGLEDSA